MNPTTLEMMKPWLAQGARDGLRMIGMYLLSKHLVQGGDAGVEAFVGAGMTLLGFGWGWFVTIGMVKLQTFWNKMNSGPVPGVGSSVTPTVVKALLVAFALSFFLADGSRAADTTPAPVKTPKLVNPFANPYDPGKCGAYFGINTQGAASSVQSTSAAPGTQVVQGGIGGTVGYGCPINAANGSFWFVEALGDINNLNGAVNGLSLTGPASFTERFGAGTPLQNMIGVLLPGGLGNNPAVPSLPLLPAGVTAGPGAPYGFLAIHEDDISASVGLAQNRQWLISYGVGAGLRYRLSNGIVADTSLEYKTATNSLCVGPLGSAGCAKIGQGARATLQFLY